MEDKVAYETNNRMLAELDRSQDQWVQSDFDEVGYESGGNLDQQEEIYPPLEVVTPLARKTRRLGENIKIESQTFSTPERAVGAIQGRHPDFVQGRMNDFKMATITGSSEEWYLRDGTMKLWLVYWLWLS